MVGKKSFKTLLKEARVLRHAAGDNAYQRAVILVAVFDDRAFRESIGAVDDFAVAQCLDAEVEDLCLSFLELREMLRCFPDASDWSDGRLRTLYDRCVQMRTKDVEEKPARKVNRVTKTELDDAVETAKHHESRARFLEAENSRHVSELDQLRARVAELETENARLHGRIEELERRTLVASG
jgi:hypothetical protein